MARSINAHWVFEDAPSGRDFLEAITPPPQLEDKLRAARDEIRQTLSNAFRDWAGLVNRDDLIEAGYVSKASVLVLRPKFRMQGSCAYRTLNDPARKPPQEADLDDGMFVPMSFLAGNGHTQPVVLSRGLFHLSELALEPLCASKGWTLDLSRPSCIRIKLGPAAHIDLALYSVPDTQFAELSEALLAKRAQSTAQASTPLLDLDEELYEALASEHILLAHREEGWKPSDPRKLESWFRAAIDRHGYILRRICRYLKAWRDFQWASCKLSSITLMACTVEALDALKGSIDKNRDDLALEVVALRMTERLQSPIENPVVRGQYLDEDWSEEMRSDYCARARTLSNSLSAALHRASTASEVLRSLRHLFGQRIPDDVSLVRIEEEDRRQISEAPAVLTSGLLRDQGRSQEAQQAVQKAGDRRYA